MGKISPKRRQFVIKSRRKRKVKIQKLKEKYFQAKKKKEKEDILEKIKRIAPHYPAEELLGIKNEKEKDGH